MVASHTIRNVTFNDKIIKTKGIQIFPSLSVGVRIMHESESVDNFQQMNKIIF